ncbi:sigma-70 family RNA polymerase sigma factor [Pseudomonas sp. LTJR-52]|uniref:sigma-70 family RNA polymerase sigma factor n=1 Tax=Pseudomonas sp. LTJR-52 TaxID=2479392 RepID=UPI000EFC9EBA|nr:sigma-70 family RNA polymerase sigma factor [Pseudomonas sp. LTJR-52]AYN94061.1 sigma-70 family RNA polymerase sigma factor [Pseudomonas sp. LTJR-52]
MHASSTSPQGDLGQLYHEHRSWVFGWLRRRLACSDSADDLTHDTFIRLLGSQELGRLAEPRAFLITVAKRVLFNHYRRQDIERAYLDALAALPEQEVPSEEVRAIALETLLELARVLDGLAEPVKQAFLLAQLDGMPYADIAAHLGVSLATVKRYIAKAAQQCYFSECMA